MAENTYGFGIAGCGMVARFHAQAISEMADARLVATYSRSEANARSLAERYGAAWYTGYGSFLRHPGMDIVTVATPSGAHLEYAVGAAQARKHVIVEKPLEITVPRMEEMIRACDRAGVKLGAIFPSRFHEASRLVKQAVAAGRFGRLTLADAYVKWYRSQEYYDEGGWKGTWAMDGGGALMNQSIHAIDLLLWFGGPVKEVQAFTATLAHRNVEVEDTAVAVLRFGSGALGVIEGATSAYPGSLKRIELAGDAGTAVLEEADITRWEFLEVLPEDEQIRKKFQARRSGGGGAGDPAAISHLPHRWQFEDFLRAVREGRAPLVDGREGMRAVQLVLAIYRSARERKPIVVAGGATETGHP